MISARNVVVYHKDMASDRFTLTALVECPGDADNTACLERAYRRTQNIEGSWSRGPTMMTRQGEVPNPDYDPQTHPCAPLPVHNGQTYGLRSSMMGDIFVLDGRQYRCDMRGFSPVQD